MTFLTRTSNCTLASSLHLRHLLHRPELGAKCLTGRWVRQGRFSQGRQSVWQWLRKQVGFYGSKIRQWSYPLLITRHLVSKEVALLCYLCVPLGFWSPVCVCVCVCVRAEFLSCVPLCHPEDCSPPGSSVHGLSQAKILKWVAISFSRGSSRPRDQTHISCIYFIGRWIFFIPELLGKHLMSYFCTFLKSFLSSTQALTTLYYLNGFPL